MLRGLRYLKVREKDALARRRGRGMRNASVTRGMCGMEIDASVRAGWIFHFFDFFLGSLKILAVRSKFEGVK